jgi:type IV fimbrial biogenesis protein FimT
MVERSGTPTPTVLRAQTEFAAVSIAGTQTNLTFTPPSGQLIGSFRSFDIAPQFPSRAKQGQPWRHCIHIAAGGRPRSADGACGATS